MNFNEFITVSTERKTFHRPRIICKDGFSMSVQCSYGNYCSPREDNKKFYTSAEIGFPNEKEDLIMGYAEDEDKPTGTVYGWVPSSVIDEVIKKHGGIDESKTFKNN